LNEIREEEEEFKSEKEKNSEDMTLSALFQKYMEEKNIL
jgi:polyhydroxyalkanoate synthesis regulator protein